MFARRIPFIRVLALLVIARAAWADLNVLDDKLALDATVWSGAYWWRAEQVGLTQSNYGFERVGALIGLTGRLGQVARLRASVDVSNPLPRDLYVDLNWPRGFGFRAGQLLLPVGMDATTEPDSQALAGYSILVGYTKPAGTRDIGILGRWESNVLAASAAVVNGSGANTSDNNQLKDLCGRLAFKALPNLGAVVALRAYFGWPDGSDSVWRTAAVEARLRGGPVMFQAEFQNHQSQNERNNATYLLALWDLGAFQPVGRLDLVLPRRSRVHWMATGGLNVRPTDHLKVMLDCSYNRDYQGGWGVFGFHLQLLATI